MPVKLNAILNWIQSQSRVENPAASFAILVESEIIRRHDFSDTIRVDIAALFDILLIHYKVDYFGKQCQESAV